MGSRGTRWSDAQSEIIRYVQSCSGATTAQLREQFGSAVDEILDNLSASGTLLSSCQGVLLPNGRHEREYHWRVNLDRNGVPVKRPLPADPCRPVLDVPGDKRGWVRFMAQMLGAYFAAKNYAVCREVGLPAYDNGGNKHGTRARADFLAVRSDLKDVVIVETKSCWSDFSSDCKWTGYLALCNRLYFAADPDTAERIRLEIAQSSPEVGVIAVARDFSPAAVTDNLSFIRSARRRTCDVRVSDLLWQMAARSSGFDMGGRLHGGNAFEKQSVLWNNFRIR